MAKAAAEEAAKSPKARSLVAFARDKKREKCKACKIPEPLRMEMAAARDKKIGQDIIIAWLQADHGLQVTVEELTSHHSGHHDRHLRELEG